MAINIALTEKSTLCFARQRVTAVGWKRAWRCAGEVRSGARGDPVCRVKAKESLIVSTSASGGSFIPPALVMQSELP